MIIATIGYRHYKLKDVVAAEQLIKILDEAIPVDDHYLHGRSPLYTVLKQDEAQEVKLSIVPGDLLSDEELKKLQDDAANKD